MIKKIGWLFVLVLVLMLGLVFAKRGIYDSKLGINVVVVGDNGVSLILIRPEENLMTWVKLPDNLSVNIVGTSAVYPLSSLWKFGVMEKNPLKITGDSLSVTMGVLLPRVIKISGDSTPENLLGSIHKWNLQTDFSIRDRILFRKDLVASVTSKRFLEIDIPKTAMTKSADPDGQEFLEINYVINLWTKNKFVFDRLLGENSNVKIYNLSSTKGAGLLLSRQLESSGIRVVEVSSNAANKIEGKGCVYKIGGTAHEYTDYLLKNFVNCKFVAKNSKEEGIGDGIDIWLL